jgi:hypothetical protein
MTTGPLARALVATPTPELGVTQVLVLDWVDGPLEGFLRLANPKSDWYFKVFAENASAEDVNDRLFALTPVDESIIREVPGTTGHQDRAGIIVVDASPSEVARLDEVIGRLGGPEVLAVFDASMMVERAWLIR